MELTYDMLEGELTDLSCWSLSYTYRRGKRQSSSWIWARLRKQFNNLRKILHIGKGTNVLIENLSEGHWMASGSWERHPPRRVREKWVWTWMKRKNRFYGDICWPWRLFGYVEMKFWAWIIRRYDLTEGGTLKKYSCKENFSFLDSEITAVHPWGNIQQQNYKIKALEICSGWRYIIRGIQKRDEEDEKIKP